VGFLVGGALLVSMALAGTVVRRLPLTTALLYLVMGVLVGPFAMGLLSLEPVLNSSLLERVAEIAVNISLFTAGLKLRVPWRDARWRVALRLALGSMVLTVGLVAVVGVVLLELPLGAAILLGAILAPTDPVLASDVQVAHPDDRDRLRVGLTGEAALNDGTAFPFVMLGLGLLGLHDLGSNGLRWLAVDVLWAVPGGLFIGAFLGTLVGRVVVYLRAKHNEALGLDEFLALGLVALAYGVALMCHAYGFLAVFAAGAALREVERAGTGSERLVKLPADPSVAKENGLTPAVLAAEVLRFNEQLERLGEVTVVLLVGSMLTRAHVQLDAVIVVPLLMLVIRPLSVWLGLMRAPVSLVQRNLMMFFGIRGIGSIYYLAYAINHGLPTSLAIRLTAITLVTIATSVLLHGISVTPLMTRYDQHVRAKRRALEGLVSSH